MGSLILDFADQLYSFLALKYEIVIPRGAAAGGPPIEEYDWPSEVFTIDIARAVMMLSYTYRSAFRRHFRSVAFLLCTSKENPKLYANIFAKVTYKRHSPLRILILCSFISEMYLFIFFQKGAENVNRYFTLPAMGCLNEIYMSVFKKIDDPIPKWEDVKRSATLIARGYDTLEPIMRTEHPSESKFFFTSVQDVLVEQGKMRCEPEGESGNAEANMPSTSTDYSSSVPVAHYDSMTDSQRTAMLAADQLADQLKETTLTKRDSPIGGEKSKSRRKKRQTHKTRACAKSDAPGPQAVASTSSVKTFTVEHSFVSMGDNKTVLKTTIKPVMKNVSPLRLDSASQRLPGVGEEATVSEDQNTEAKSESPDGSKEIPIKTSASSITKAKSRKHKKKRG